jgi:methionyl-tRNA formyltransferase
MDKARVLVCGSGREISFFLKTLVNDIDIIGYCPPAKFNGEDESTSFCREQNIPMYKTHKVIYEIRPDYVFMVSYPALIEKCDLDAFTFLNIHGALLPRYRGMHGGTWAIVNGEKQHGYSLHLVDEGIDSGPIYHQGVIESDINDTVIQIREEIYNSYKKDIRQVFLDIINKKIIPVPQIENEAIYVSTRKPEDGLINWNKTAAEIHNLVRAVVPPQTPGAYTFYKGNKIVITSTEIVDMPAYIGKNGQIVANFKGAGVYVKCCDKCILVKDIVFEGKQINTSVFFKTVGAVLSSGT